MSRGALIFNCEAQSVEHRQFVVFAVRGGLPLKLARVMAMVGAAHARELGLTTEEEVWSDMAHGPENEDWTEWYHRIFSSDRAAMLSGVTNHLLLSHVKPRELSDAMDRRALEGLEEAAGILHTEAQRILGKASN